MLIYTIYMALLAYGYGADSVLTALKKMYFKILEI